MEFGLSAKELAYAVAAFLEGAMSRVRGTGREQYELRAYNGEPYQAFEEMTPVELLVMAREEVQDLGVYAAMLDLRLARLQAKFEANAVVGDAR
jgi:hypothetical protein